jgi:adenylate kinase
MEEEMAERLELVMAHIKELDECEDLNMRQFLMKFIVPVLTEGMIEVWKFAPIDPVDYLADYMYKKSNNMK